MTIDTTKVIGPGDELLLFYELPNYDDKLRDDNAGSELEKQSTSDKRKQNDELSEDHLVELINLSNTLMCILYPIFCLRCCGEDDWVFDVSIDSVYGTCDCNPEYSVRHSKKYFYTYLNSGRQQLLMQ